MAPTVARCGDRRGRRAAASRSGSATRTASPRLSIHAVPLVPTTRVSIRKGPRSAAVLCMTPTTPERMRKCTTNPSSAVVVRAMFTSDAVTASNSPSVTRIWSITCEPCAPSHPPPCAASAHHSGSSASRSASTGTCSTNSARRGSPISAFVHGAREERLPGVEPELGAEQVHDAGIARGRERASRASAASRANGFSHSTCLPGPERLEHERVRGYAEAWRS